MRLLFTLTSYPPAIGGAQQLMHQLARQLAPRHALTVATQWDSNRNDWLFGTTLRGPLEPHRYQIDGVSVRRIALPAAARRPLAPWVYGYYAFQGPALKRIAAALARELAPLAAEAELIHNCRIGREGLSFASLRVARAKNIPFVLTPVHHPRWGGWLHRHYHRLYRQADAVIALTETERQTLARLGVDQRRIFVAGARIPIIASSHVTYALDSVPGLVVAEDWVEWCEGMSRLAEQRPETSPDAYLSWEARQPRPIQQLARQWQQCGFGPLKSVSLAAEARDQRPGLC